MDEELRELGSQIALKHDGSVLSVEVENGELTIFVIPTMILTLLDALRTDRAIQLSTLVDITAVDYPTREKRFDVVYHLLSMYQNTRVRLKASIREDQTVPSVCSIHKAAEWYEREVFDMYGVKFSDHPDLRRLLTDYGFQGFPLRKDFPTTGFTEVRYDEAQKTVIYEPVSLVQEYRQFDFMSPWEGAEYILPGDEKEAQG
jgi:NADH-quinone oxidoreductase subunit C